MVFQVCRGCNGHSAVTLRCERSEPRRATALARSDRHPSRAASRPPQDEAQSWLDVLVLRPSLAIVDGLLEKFLRIIGPELAHIRIGLDHGVDELAVLLLDLADVDVADHVAVFVEAHRATAGV